MTTKNAVLMLVFNRPEVTRRILQAVKEAKPPRLYVAADGPRPNNRNDQVQSQAVRALFDQIDWPCEIHTRFLERNLGCRMAVSSAIDWFFEQEEQGIVLEDDTLPNASFSSSVMSCWIATKTMRGFFRFAEVIWRNHGFVRSNPMNLPDTCVCGGGPPGDGRGITTTRLCIFGRQGKPSPVPFL